MYLFTRSRRVSSPDLVGAMGWVVGTTEQVRNITGHQIDAWGTVMSPDAGTIVWSLWAEHLIDIEQAADKLAASPEYAESVKQGDAFFDGPVVDGLASLVHGSPDPDVEVNYVTVASAVAAPGHLSDAIAGGVEIAEHATRVSGQNTLFLMNATGPYGGCAWITGSPDVGVVEAGETALMADPAWLKLIDRAGTAYTPEAAQTMYRRIV
jgi:hypothetical protein